MSSSRTLNGFQGFVMAGCLFAQASGSTIIRPATAASISWKGEATLSTTALASELPLPASEASAVVAVKGAIDGLNLAALAKSVFPESRSMEQWEKEVTHDFVLSHFR